MSKYINNNGNALLTVLLVSLVFTTIGLAIVASSISGTKRVETRESDISITYQSKKVLDEITATMAKSIGEVDLEVNNSRSISTDFEEELASKVLIKSLNQILANPNYNPYIECLSIVDISNANSMDVYSSDKACSNNDVETTSLYSINKNLDYTRVLEIVLITNNPEETEGDITRTLRKRIILSPLPSFLKYAVGSDSSNEEEGLFLNGSPNIAGNIFANMLHISDEANYQQRNGDWNKVSALLPSVTGVIYSTASAIIPLLEDDNFYKGEVPSLNHDSQFIDIEYDATFIQRVNNILSDNNLPMQLNSIEDIPTLLVNWKNHIQSIIQANSFITNEDSQSLQVQVPATSLIGDSLEELEDSFSIESNTSPLVFDQPISIDGSVVINSTNNKITFNDELVVNGDLYLVSNEDMSFSAPIFVSGDVHIVNFSGAVDMYSDIIASGSITIESEAEQSDDLNNGIHMQGNILSGSDLTIRPLNTSASFNSNMISIGDFTVGGDEKGEHLGENDVIQFNSVVYSLGESFVSNVNIIGLIYEDTFSNQLTEGQLILLAKNKLTITRMNEFNQFEDLDENGYPYLPNENTAIKPLKAFFYTEDNAELYGVGSLFYIKGGIFANKKLEINAIRANQSFNSIQDIPSSSEGKLSRFIVDYDQDVLIKGIDALPIVDKLQIIPDEFIIE